MMLMKKYSGGNMEYTIYFDIFFLNIFFMNSIVLKSMSWILGRKCSWIRLLLSALTGTLINCAAIFIKIQIPGLSFMTAVVMSLLGFGIQREGKDIVYPFFLMFLAFCVEGAITWSHSPTGALLVPLLSYLIGKERKRQLQLL